MVTTESKRNLGLHMGYFQSCIPYKLVDEKINCPHIPEWKLTLLDVKSYFYTLLQISILHTVCFYVLPLVLLSLQMDNTSCWISAVYQGWREARHQLKNIHNRTLQLCFHTRIVGCNLYTLRKKSCFEIFHMFKSSKCFWIVTAPPGPSEE